MTREELRDYVEEQRSLNMIPYHVYSTLIDGIDTLEQEPTTKNKLGVDCISRDDVWDVMQELWGTSGELIDRLMSLPPVTPIRPKGQWIDHSDEGYVECPRCGSATNCDENINDLHFCFSCGAEMDGVEV